MSKVNTAKKLNQIEFQTLHPVGSYTVVDCVVKDETPKHDYLITKTGDVYVRTYKEDGVQYQKRKPSLSGYGYDRMYKEGKCVHIHTLILEKFVGTRPSPNHVCDHIDRNAQNNALSNLRWVTYSENSQNYSKSKKVWASIIATSPTGETLTFSSQVEAAKYIGVTQVCIANVLRLRNQKKAKGWTISRGDIYAGRPDKVVHSLITASSKTSSTTDTLVFSSVAIAAAFFECSLDTIYRALNHLKKNGTQRKVKGYTFSSEKIGVTND